MPSNVTCLSSHITKYATGLIASQSMIWLPPFSGLVTYVRQDRYHSNTGGSLKQAEVYKLY